MLLKLKAKIFKFYSYSKDIPGNVTLNILLLQYVNKLIYHYIYFKINLQLTKNKNKIQNMIYSINL